jgi:hypothetical protein
MGAVTSKTTQLRKILRYNTYFIREIKERAQRIVRQWISPLRTRYPRRFQAYCIGTGKSGTHSIAGLFSRRYRTAHEPEREFIIDTILAAASGLISEEEKVDFIRKRDKRLWLELESSVYIYHFLDILVREFPHAKFILTIRDCYSWLNSYMNHKLAGPVSDKWWRMREFRYRPDKFTYAKEEQILFEHGLYPLDSYLSAWGTHNRKVPAIVPKEKLLVVRTHEIIQNITRIAEILEIPVETLDPSKAHLFKTQRNFGILSKIDRDFLEEKVNIHCRDVMNQYFPEIRCFNDVIGE